MKILLFFTFYLISGPVSCFDVIGFSGGDVMIYCAKPRGTNGGYNMYFCKESVNQCVYPESDSALNTWDHKGRVSVNENSGFLTVIYRDLNLMDTGSYRCGETGEWSNTVNLIVKTDKCCSGPKTVTGRPGETITISCSYPEEFKEKAKFFSTLKGLDFTEMAHTSAHLNRRFSISENRTSNIISMKISDVRKGDEDDYYCGVSGDSGVVSYDTFFTKIHLQFTDSSNRIPAPTTPMKTTSAPGSLVAISLSIILSLLLIGGAVLVYFIVILKKRQGSTPSARTNCSDHKEVPDVVSNDEETGTTTPTPPKDLELTYSTSTPPKDQDLTYSTPTPPKDQDLTYSTPTLPKDQEITYSTVSFHKNPGSSTDASVRVSKEEPETEYATVKNPK